MASTIESMHGIIHEINAKLGILCSTQNTPRSASSGSKRSRHDSSHIVDTVPLAATLQEEPVAREASVATIFNSHFRPSASGYNPATLSSKPTETFVYDWYARGLGVVKGYEVELTQRSWMSAIGSKVSTDNLLDAKSLIKLVEMLATKSELDSLKDPQPNAATDPAHGDWEQLMRGICKVLTTVTNDFLTMKEGKVGNAKTLTLGAMARRWKVKKFPAPTKDERQQLRNALSSSSSKQKTSSSSFSSSSKNATIKAKSTLLKPHSKVQVTV